MWYMALSGYVIVDQIMDRHDHLVERIELSTTLPYHRQYTLMLKRPLMYSGATGDLIDIYMWVKKIYTPSVFPQSQSFI